MSEPVTIGIYGFEAEHRYLSNFSLDGFEFFGVWYPTNEHFYQAAKAMFQGDFLRVLAADTPGKAKRAGRTITCRPDWDAIKVQVMALGIALKFSPGTPLAEKLLATNHAYLEETNTWGDKFWGVCEGEGENYLGRILMQQRTNLRGKP